MRLAVVGLLAALLSPVAVTACAAATPPDAVRAAVAPEYAQIMAGMYDDTDPASPRPGPPPNAMFSAHDLNGDGLKDWRVDYEHAQNPSFFCGTGGCRQQLFMAQPGGGYRLVFDSLLRELKFGKAKGEFIMDVDFHGSVCGRAGVEECPRRFGWDSVAGRYLERVNRKGSGWLPGGSLPLIPLPASTWPAAVKQQIERRTALCKAADGVYDLSDHAPYDLPDLNGDGVRDWVVGGSYDYCNMGETGKDSPAMPITLMISQPGGGFTSGWEQTDAAWGVELGATNRLATVIGDDCFASTTPCAKAYWRWTGSRFEKQP